MSIVKYLGMAAITAVLGFFGGQYVQSLKDSIKITKQHSQIENLQRENKSLSSKIIVYEDSLSRLEKKLEKKPKIKTIIKKEILSPSEAYVKGNITYKELIKKMGGIGKVSFDALCKAYETRKITQTEYIFECLKRKKCNFDLIK